MNRIERSHPPFTIAVEWTGTATTSQAEHLLQQLEAVPTETRRAKDAVYLLSGSDPEQALATWGTILSTHHLNVPLDRNQADTVIREAQRLTLPGVASSPTSDEPGRATPEPPTEGDAVTSGVVSGHSKTGGEPSSDVPSPTSSPPVLDVAIERAGHVPTAKMTVPEIDRHVRDLFDAMWEIGIWTADSLSDALDGGKLSDLNKTDLLSFAKAWSKRAQTDLVADAPGGSR